MKYFGTDGIRGIYDVNLEDLASKVGIAAAMMAGDRKILVGGDTRESTPKLVKKLLGGILKGGGKADYIGVASTPAVSYLTKVGDYGFGIVITASHNPPKCNGIKFFNDKGEKLNEAEISVISRLIQRADFSGTAKVEAREELLTEYISYIKGLLPNTSKRIVIDCSNGACGKIAKEIFSYTGVSFLNESLTNGRNINEGVGALYPEVVARQTVAEKAIFGFALDGDGDRIAVADEGGGILNGDDLLYILANKLKAENRLEGNKVVATYLSNGALKELLEEKGISLIYSDIGDGNVLSVMKQCGAALGGEQSGHIIIGDKSMTGDGLLVATELLDIDTPLSCKKLPYLYPQRLINIEMDNKESYYSSNEFQSAIRRATAILLPNNGRVLVRLSGTENKIRIMLEAKEEATLQQAIDEVEKLNK